MIGNRALFVVSVVAVLAFAAVVVVGLAGASAPAEERVRAAGLDRAIAGIAQETFRHGCDIKGQ